MLMLYFSGTGNSKYIAETFSTEIKALCYSIEEPQDFERLIKQNEIIGFCFPTYGSKVPRIMREFVLRHINHLKGKKLIIFCTQLLFSGDGARVFCDLLPKGHAEVIYAEHFNMPNNICNIPIFKVTNGEENKKCLFIADRKINKVCGNIKNGIIKKRGFNFFSRCLGLIQGTSFPAIEMNSRDSVRTDSDCNGCGICVKICPMKNLELVNMTVKPKGNCTLCYRCVNACPKKAITVFINRKPVKQYKGI